MRKQKSCTSLMSRYLIGPCIWHVIYLHDICLIYAYPEIFDMIKEIGFSVQYSDNSLNMIAVVPLIFSYS